MFARKVKFGAAVTGVGCYGAFRDMKGNWVE